MFPRRFVVVAAIALLILGLIMAGGAAAAQRQAWMQGYMLGRMSTGTDGANSLAPVLPYMVPGYGGYAGPHFGGFGLLLGIGALFLLFGFLRFVGCMAWRHGGPWGRRGMWGGYPPDQPGQPGPQERSEAYAGRRQWHRAPWWAWEDAPGPRSEQGGGNA